MPTAPRRRSAPVAIGDLADVLEVFHRRRRRRRRRAVALERRGTQSRPGARRAVRRVADDLFAVDASRRWEAVIAAEPARAAAERRRRRGALRRSPTSPTSVAVTVGTRRPGAISPSRRRPAAGRPRSRYAGRAGLCTASGRLGVPNGWDKPGDTDASPSRTGRLHPYLTERSLASSPGRRLGAIAVQHTSASTARATRGGLTGESITPAGRVLAAADAYHAMTEPRPHRAALSADAAAAELRDGVRASLFDAGSSDAALRAAGTLRRGAARQAEVVAAISRAAAAGRGRALDRPHLYSSNGVGGSSSGGWVLQLCRVSTSR